jgi:hypothetical protein
MTSRLKKILAGIAALAALAFGGAALAQAGGDDSSSGSNPPAATAPENENDQAGDRGDANENESADDQNETADDHGEHGDSPNDADSGAKEDAD